MGKVVVQHPEVQKPGKKRNGGARPGSGRKPFVPTEEERKLVEDYSGNGLPYEQIATLIRNGIDRDTLRKYFSEELTKGKAKANAQIGKTLFQKAIDGDTTAMIWWTKTQMRWAETQKHEISGPDGEEIRITSSVEVYKVKLPDNGR